MRFTLARVSCLHVFYKDRVGGRLVSVKMPTVNGTDEWDMGGQWVARLVSL